MALTKYAIVEKLQSDLGFSKTKSIDTFETLIELIKATLESGEDVLVSGFGKFSVQERGSTQGPESCHWPDDDVASPAGL